MQPVSTIHKHSYKKPTTTATGSAAPYDAEWCMLEEIEQLSDNALNEALFHIIMELNIEQQKKMLAKGYEIISISVPT